MFKSPQARDAFAKSQELLKKLGPYLAAAGYQPSSIDRLLRTARQIAAWLARRGRWLGEIGEGVLERFRRRQTRAGRRTPIRFMVAFLRAEGLLGDSRLVRELPAVLRDFRQWMSDHRGAMESTLDGYCAILTRLVASLGEDPKLYTPRNLQGFVLKRAEAYRDGHAQKVVTAVRMFLRYLACVGLVPDALRHAVPKVAQWRLAALPRGLGDRDIRRLVRSCDARTAVGSRDRAILVLGVRLALRAGEIAALRLTSIDWEQATLCIAGKGRRAVRLPLPQDVGDALLAYLKRGRAVCGDDHVFLRAAAPRGPLTRYGVSDIVDRALGRAVIEAPCRGAHLLRHSAASAMLRRGCSLPDIASVLRHRSIETSAIYAKVDFPLLQEIAQPWPEVRS